MKAAIDTETEGLNWRADMPFFVSFYREDGFALSADLREGEFGALREIVDLAGRVDRLFFHNAKFDLHALSKVGAYRESWWPKIGDTIVREYLLDEHRLTYRLDDVAFDRLGERKIDLSAETGFSPEYWRMAPKADVKRYCERDAALTLRVALDQERELVDQELLGVERLEIEALEAVFAMERHGVRVDLERAEAAKRAIHREMLQSLQALYSKHGKFWPGSPKEVTRVLQIRRKQGAWRLPDGSVVPETDGGAPKLDEATLRSMPGELPGQILQFKTLEKLSNTFLAKHVISNAVEGPGGHYVRANINSTKSLSGRGTGTGRLSYDSPALQQIPSRSESAAAVIKPVFLPDPGEFWVYGDLDQNEFRVFAHFTYAEKLYEAYRKNPKTDFHGLVAEETGLPRKASRPGEANAKQVNLGLIFNMGAGLLAQTMGLPYTTDERGNLKPGPEVLEVLDRYHSAIPGVREINQQCTRYCEINGFVRTLAGRKIRIPDPEFSYKAAGLMFQAVAADNNKRNIALIHRRLKEFGQGRLLINIHDEYSLSLPWSSQAEDFLRHVCDEIADAGLNIPLSIDFSWGADWHDAL